MAQQTIIYLVRHGESESNLADIVSGGGDNPDLTEKGKKQAHQARQNLSDVEFHHVYSSDLKRAIKTAEIVAGHEVHPDNQLKRLREKDYGRLEGTSNSTLNPETEMRRELPKAKSWAHKAHPEMESDEELADRIIGQIEQLAEKHRGETILIGSHGTAIRVIYMRLKDIHYKELPGRFKNGGHIKLIYDDGKLLIDEINGYN